MTMTTPETHPHQAFRLAWFDPASPGVIVDNSIHLTTGSARKCAAAMAKDAPELRAHGSRVFLTDAHRKILDDLQTNPVPWMSLDDQFFIAGPWASNAWWTNSIGPNVVQLPEFAPAIASGGGMVPPGSYTRVDMPPIVMDQPTVQPQTAAVITGQDANKAMNPVSPVVPQATVQADPPAVPAYVPIAATVAYVPKPEPRPLPAPAPPPSNDKVINAYAIEWTGTGADTLWSIHDGVPSIFALAEANLRRRPQWRPTAHICLVSARTDASRREAETGAEGAYWVAPGAMVQLTDRLEKCDAPWVANLMASYATPDKWEGIAADLRAQGYSTTVAGHVPANTPTVVPAAPEATPTATEEITTALDAAVAEPKEASLPAWLAPKAPPAPSPAPAVAAPPVMATAEESAKRRGRKAKDSTPAEPRKRGRKKVAAGETAPLALDVDANIPDVVATPAPMAAVQGPPVVVPGDTWDKPGAVVEALLDCFGGGDANDRAEEAACEQDAAIAVATIHIQRAMGRIRLAAHALPMATHEPEREAMMATIGRLHDILADLEGPTP